MATELQTEPLSEPQLRRKLEPALREMTGAATLGDITAATGLPAERSEPVIRALLDEFNGRISVDDRGQLIYSFPRGMVRDATFQEKFARLMAAVWSAVKMIYKVGISVMLVLYFVIFLIIAVALIVALLSRGSDSDVDLGGLDFDGCGDGCAQIFFWMPVPIPVDSGPRHYVRRDRYGRPYAVPVPQRQRKPRGLPFWLRVYEYVFGPDQPATDPLADERELLAYLRDNQGLVTAVELAALRGISIEQAEKLALHLMVEHNGEVDVSDNGTLIYRFDDLLVSAQEQAAPAERVWRWSWERSEAEPKLNRNQPGENATITFLNLFNLIGAAAVGHALWTAGAGWGAVIGLGIFPFLFASTLFLIPLARWLRLPGRRREVAQRNQWRDWLRRLIGQPTQAFLYDGAPGLPEFTAAMGGAEVRDGRGLASYEFDRWAQELADVAAARAQVDPLQHRLGPIAYDSDE